jgi:hypothetical protein
MTDSQIKTFSALLAADLERARVAQAGWLSYLHETGGCSRDEACAECCAERDAWCRELAEGEERDYAEFGAESLSPERGGPV